MRKSSPRVWVKVTAAYIGADTDKAFLCSIGPPGKRTEHWIPKSQIRDFDPGDDAVEVGKLDVELWIPRWLADEKELEGEDEEEDD